jgi:signal transduction histidine kinase
MTSLASSYRLSGRLWLERVLAKARAGLAIGGLIALRVDPAEPATHIELVYLLFVAYVVMSVVLALILRGAADVSSSTPFILYFVDFCFAAALTLLTAGLSSPLFVFFWFFLLAGAFRFGLRGALASGGLLMLTIVLQWLWGPPAGLNLVIARLSYVGVMAFVVGYFAQRERESRIEAVVVARALGRIRGARPWTQGFERAVDELAREFQVRRAILAIESPDGQRSCWELWREPGEMPSTRSVQAAELDACFAPLPEPLHVWYSDRLRGDIRAIDFDGERTRVRASFGELCERLGARSVIGVVAPLGDGTFARAFIIDPPPAQTTWFRLHLLHTVTLFLVPAVHNLVLLERESGSQERARVANELHDRVLQSLIGLQLQLAAAASVRPSELVARISEFASMLQHEILNVRDLMNDLRPVELSSVELPFYLHDVVERFQTHTGINSVLEITGDLGHLSKSQCTELARLIHEALVNVRKHSGASNVHIVMHGTSSGVKVMIEDDGRGFSFSGRLDLARLSEEHRGPRVIKERARAIGASLEIESRPGAGARLEVFIPHAV